MGSRRRCCCTTGTTICVEACGTLHVYGALVQVWTDSTKTTLVAQCTTGTGGCCTVSVSGPYYVTVIMSGTVEYAGTVTLTGTVTLLLGSAGFICCGGYAIPYTLTLTDALGSLTLSHVPASNPPAWTGGRSASVSSSTVTTPNNTSCLVAAPTVGPVSICYQMICVSTSSPLFSLARYWSWVDYGPTPEYFQDQTSVVPGVACPQSGPSALCTFGYDTSTGKANPTTSSPFAISFALAPLPGNVMADPVGGGASVSQ